MVKPPIAADVAAVIGEYAEKVENRSLLLNKFPVHKHWPVDPVQPKGWDDASRWSFIRVAENGREILERERKIRNARANGHNVGEDKRQRSRDEVKLLDRLLDCGCRKLDEGLAKMRKERAEEWMRLLGAQQDRHLLVIGSLCGPLAVNLSDSLIQNAGICLDHLFGEPYIPGSAVKGVCRHVALARVKSGELSIEDFQQIFGSVGSDFDAGGDLAMFAGQVAKERRTRKGLFAFLAAFPMDAVKLAVDLTNVHYPAYYASGQEADLSQEAPRPNPFLVTSADKNPRFVFSVARLCGPANTVAPEVVESILREALEKRGIGAKTGSGYGWFDCSATDAYRSKIKSEREKAELASHVEELVREIGLLTAMPDPAAPEFKTKIGEIEASPYFGQLAENHKSELKRQKKRIPPPSLADKLRDRWQKSLYQGPGKPNCKAVCNSDDIKKFDSHKDELKQAIVALLREADGVGSEVWRHLKQTQPAGFIAICAYSKKTLGRKMP